MNSLIGPFKPNSLVRNGRNVIPGIAGGGASAAATAEAAWYARAVALGASPPAATRSALVTFYGSLFSAGFALADFDFMYLMIGENSGDTSTNKYNQKRVNLVAPGTFDATIISANASGHTATGTLGNATMYWRTGFNSTTRTVNRGADNTTLGVVATAVGVALSTAAAGCNDTHRILPRLVEATSYATYGGSNASAVTSASPQLIYGEATSSLMRLYRGSTQIGTSASTNTALPTSDIAVFGQWNGTSAFQLSDETYAFAWHGRALTGTNERTNFYAAVQALMAAFSVTI